MTKTSTCKYCILNLVQQIVALQQPETSGCILLLTLIHHANANANKKHVIIITCFLFAFEFLHLGLLQQRLHRSNLKMCVDDTLKI